MNARQAKTALVRVSAALSAIPTRSSLLDEVAWPRDVEERFFAGRASRLPVVAYVLDRTAHEEELASLRAIEKTIEGDGPVPAFLRNTVASHIDRVRMLLAVGTQAFGVISRAVYGGAKTRFFGLPLSNLDLARHLEERLSMHGWDAIEDGEDPTLDAKEMAALLRRRIAKRKLPVKVVLDANCTSKVIAGMRHVRVRPDATFTTWEAEGLYRHEVETHAYTALNGAAQPHASFLKAGGPCSTATQEGLAVFAELFHRALAVPRLRRLALRVRIVAMAEDGASFLDVYRFLVREHGTAPRDAFLDAARIFRGGVLEGGSPFTKDACYLAGLVEVHQFLATFVRGGFRDECELLVSGRFALEDLDALVSLKSLGVIARPRWRPRWLRDWGTLLPFFAFTSFLDGIDLVPVSRRYAEVIRLATDARPRERTIRPSSSGGPSAGT